MSISASLSNALSGLNAAARGAEITSANISNALTEGYGRRDLALSARGGGAGSAVRVEGVVRHSNPGLLGDRRLADAELGQSGGASRFFDRLEELMGTPDQAHSLTAAVADFEARLIEAASAPHSGQRLGNAVRAAGTLAGGLARVSDGIQALRAEADAAIAADVGRLNTGLAEIQNLNSQIAKTRAMGHDTSGLEDNRQQAIDRIASLVPLREVSRDRGTVALYTTGGAVLLDGTAAELTFERSNTVTADMSVADGTLSGLTLNGIPVEAGGDGPLRGGRLAAQFDLRDRLAPDAQQQLDLAARDLIERFQSSGVDPTLAPGDAGLFTDGGAALAPAATRGLAGRIALNPAVDPAAGGESWRVRDGLGAAAEGNRGEAGLLISLRNTLTGSGAGTGAAFAVMAELSASAGAARDAADRSQGLAAARHSALKEAELAEGVDTDRELQRLMLVEQSYAANARMIQTIDEMMQTLLRL